MAWAWAWRCRPCINQLSSTACAPHHLSFSVATASSPKAASHASLDTMHERYCSNLTTLPSQIETFKRRMVDPTMLQAPGVSALICARWPAASGREQHCKNPPTPDKAKLRPHAGAPTPPSNPTADVRQLLPPAAYAVRGTTYRMHMNLIGGFSAHIPFFPAYRALSRQPKGPRTPSPPPISSPQPKRKTLPAKIDKNEPTKCPSHHCVYTYPRREQYIPLRNNYQY
ncbi:uncharacterized protein Ecym_4582 [Eremothecium cymbalariae DBVPG|uniref:Uncharacterized protein n=1 Tax=Eremothecium cymbalariae (strain CBS 270.75 / DBVPG 7215 / KCTC 17166 / NRRL Y-17582) TaxID=931890 RepID=G8JS93_ERECY|nr:hypothetical protein Ecym_4582 [Eremothecium cymbalariae DBVPG\